jgi:hypothetical protein
MLRSSERKLLRFLTSVIGVLKSWPLRVMCEVDVRLKSHVAFLHVGLGDTQISDNALKFLCQ